MKRKEEHEENEEEFFPRDDLKKIVIDLVIFGLAYMGLLGIHASYEAVSVSVLEECAMSLALFYVPYRFIEVCGFFNIINILFFLLFPFIIIGLENIGFIKIIYFNEYVILMVVTRLILSFDFRIK